MPKVVLVDANRLKGAVYNIEQKIFNENNIEFIVKNCNNEEEIIENCKDADGILTIYTKIHKEIISKLSNCKVIVRYGIGYDVIDVDAASEKGIAVCNIPDYCIQEVATHTLALILSLERKITMYDRSIRKGEWDEFYGYPIHRLNTLTLGLLGFGSIARKVAEYAKPFGFNIIAYDPYLPDEIFHGMEVERVQFDNLLQESDIISIHVPLNKETKHLINKETISKMKNTVKIINTSRGAIIAQDDFVNALKNKRIMAAGLDVLETEPLHDPDADILKFENVIVTPHAAFNTVEATEELHRKVAESACKVIKGELPQNVVNKQKLIGR